VRCLWALGDPFSFIDVGSNCTAFVVFSFLSGIDFPAPTWLSFTVSARAAAHRVAQRHAGRPAELHQRRRLCQPERVAQEQVQQLGVRRNVGAKAAVAHCVRERGYAQADTVKSLHTWR